MNNVVRGVAAIIFSFLLVGPQSVHGQWKRLNTFSQPVTSVFFQKGNCLPGTGFVGTEGWAIYKTIDGGVTWKNVLLHSVGPNYVSSFTFKDSLVGWCSVTDFGASPTDDAIWKTNDGGETWSSLHIVGAYPDIYYHAPTQRLFIAAWNGADRVSLNDGASWTQIALPLHNSIVFSTPMLGLYSSVRGTQNMVTNDGGVSWRVTPFTDEVFSPLAVPCSPSIVASGEGTQQVLRSDDGGNSWVLLSTFPMFQRITGQTVGDRQHLFVQTGSEVLTSPDMGVSWSSIGGPGNNDDTRMCTRGGYLFAADLHGGLFLWQYDKSVPKFSTLTLSSDTLIFPAKWCDSSQLPFTFSAAETCSDCMDSLRFVQATISGSHYFKILSQPTGPSVISGTQSIIIVHDPAITTQDTARLILTFEEYGQREMREIVLQGSSILPVTERVRLWTEVQKQSVSINAGEVVHGVVFLADAVPLSTGLNSVSFKLGISSGLTRLNVQGINGWSVAQEIDNLNDLQLIVGSSPHAALAGETIATIDLSTYLDTNADPVITLQDVNFNSGDPKFEVCSLTPLPPTDVVTVHFNKRCGDSTILAMLKGKPLITVLGVSPDPLFRSGMRVAATLHLRAGAVSAATITVTNLLGTRVLPPMRAALSAGDNAVLIDLSTLPEGAYLISLDQSSGSAKVVIQSGRN